MRDPDDVENDLDALEAEAEELRKQLAKLKETVELQDQRIRGLEQRHADLAGKVQVWLAERVAKGDEHGRSDRQR